MVEITKLRRADLEEDFDPPGPDDLLRLVFLPVHATGFAPSRLALPDLLPDEVFYEDERRARDSAGNVVPFPYAAPRSQWIASATDLARVLAALSDPDRSPLLSRKSIESLSTASRSATPGSTAHIERFPNGRAVVVLLNIAVGDREGFDTIGGVARSSSPPEQDLFARY